MSKMLRTAAFIVGAVALVVATGGAAAIGIGTAAVAGTAATATTAAVAGSAAAIGGVSAGTLTLAATGLSLAAGLTAKKPSATGGGAQTSFKADPDAGIPYAIGRTGTGGNIVFHRAADGWSGKTKNDLGDFVTILSGAGPVQSIDSLSIDNAVVTFDGVGNAAGGYRDYLFYKSQLGATPEATAITVTAGVSARPTGWATNYKLSGYAAAITRFRFDTKNKKYPNGTPQPLWVIKGVKVYDPRLDSTYPGGSGSCRALAENTYVWSENPYLHGLTWCLGRYQNDQRVLGAGAPIAGIDVAAFVEGANIADTNGWKVGGVVYSTDNKYDVLKQMLQAGSGEPMRLGAKISCLVNTPRVSLATINVGDVVGDVSVTATQAQRDRINGVIPRYRSEANAWAIVPAAPIRVASYVAVDGGQRTKEIEYTLCQDLNQAATLARYDIENAREFGPISLPLKLRWMGYRPGDCITVDLPEVGLASQLVLLLNRSLEPASGIVTMTARSETAAKHAFALGQTGVAPATPSVAGSPLIPTPAATEWAITALSLSGSGVTIPDLALTGAADPSTISAIVLEYRVYTGTQGDDDDWIGAGRELPSLTRRDITSVISNTDYQVSIRYEMGGVLGTRLILGPVTTDAWNGIAGAPGDSVDIIFQRAASQPATPSPSAGAPSGWYSDAGSVPGGAGLIWSSVGTKAGTGSNYTWQTALKIEGSDGSPGGAGLSIAELMIWQRAASAPSTPSGGSYDFGSKVLTPPSGWTAGIPTGDDPAYQSRATASITGTTGTAAPGAWSAPVLAVKNGADGTNALSMTLDDAIFLNSASREVVAGSAGRLADHYRALLVGAVEAQARWCSPTAFAVIPGETLYYQHVVQCDTSNADRCNASIAWYAADGSPVSATNLSSQTNFTSAEGVNTWITKRATITVPAGVAFCQPYVERPTWGGSGTFFVGEPYIGRAQPGATVGAPSGTNVGSTAATIVEAGGNAANNGVNSDGTIKTDKVGTPALLNNTVINAPGASGNGTGIGTSPVTVCSVSWTPNGADSKLIVLYFGIGTLDADNAASVNLNVSLNDASGALQGLNVSHADAGRPKGYSGGVILSGRSGLQTFSIVATRSVNSGSTAVCSGSIVIIEAKKTL